MGAWLQRPPGNNGKDPRGHIITLDGSEWCTEYQALAEFLSLDRYESGKPRRSGSLTLCVEDGLWKAVLNDRDPTPNEYFFLAGASPEDVWRAIDDCLREGTAPWRKSKFNNQQKK